MKFSLALALVIATQAAPPNDPVLTLPDSYKLQFENDWVKVVRVTYAPYAKLPSHAHTKSAAAFVYLNDAGPVIFRHTDQHYRAVTRPATKARSFRINRAMQEQHEVENTSGVASEFLRVEFKTEQREPNTMRGRFYAEPANTRIEQLQFDNAQLRVTRISLSPSQHVHLATTPSQPALLIAVTPAASAGLALGQERWLDVNQALDLENSGTAAIEILRFDLKSPPIELTHPR